MLRPLPGLAILLLTSLPVGADVLINEIFFDPGGAGLDRRDEFIELRGPAGMSLDNHFLLFLESEDNSTNTGPAGLIDNIFDLNGFSLGSNGFLVFRQSGDNAGSGPSVYPVVPGATDLINTGSGTGYGSGTGSSTIGASDVGNEGVIENGAFTAMLIRNDSGDDPVLNADLDTDNNGLDDPNGQAGWEVLDSVSVFEPFEAIFGQAYGQVVFGTEAIGELAFFEGGIVEANPGLEPGAEYLGTGWEIEYVGRWGNSTGQTLSDWHASNLTDDSASGSQGAPLDFRQSFTGDHGDLGSGNINTPPSQPSDVFPNGEEVLESTQSVPYGTALLTNVGGPNFILGDYNGNGVVDAADYTVWRDSEGAIATELAMQPADHNHDFVVDGEDYSLWAQRFGGPTAVVGGESASVVPEPSTLAALCLALAASRVSRRG